MILEKEIEKMIELAPKELSINYKRLKRTLDVLFNEPLPEVGLTPKEVIWTKNKTKLYRYISSSPKKYQTPLLMIYALINKPYILDLTKGSSMVEYLTNQGFDVYLLDWGTPRLEDKQMKLDDYIFDYIPRAVKKVLRTSKAEEISILGYCMGGTMTAIFAALHPNLPIKNLIFMTSPFDFSETGLYGCILNEHYFDVDDLVETMGNVPSEMIDFGNKLLKPITNFFGPYKSLYDRSENEHFVENWKLMQKWLSDGIPFPGEAYRQWIRDFYQQNKLMNDELIIRGHKVQLSNITANVLNLSGERDHIAMPHQVEAIMNKISSRDKKYVQLPTGHVSITIGPLAKKWTYPTISEWLKARSKHVEENIQ